MPDNNQTIILVDKSTDLKDLENFPKSGNSKIVTFDVATHEKLKEKDISHKISDMFLTPSRIDEIQTRCYAFARWANAPEIQESFKYGDFNLGNFFYHEIFIFLIPILKKLIEIREILERYPDSAFISSGLLKQIVELQNRPCGIIGKDESESGIFHHDYIKLQNNLLGIKISRSNYFKFKKLMEKTTRIFSGSKKDLKNGVLLVEFNTVQYSSLLDKLHQNNLNPIFYGRRRPAIWNVPSFLSVKNSQTGVFIEDDLLDGNMKKSICSDTEKITPNILSILEDDEFFENFFVINGISFWKIIKPFFVHLGKRRIPEAIKELHLASRLLEKTSPKCILVLSESSYTDQFIISQARTQNIPVMLLQHGVGGSDGPESNIINEFTGSMPILSDKFLIWGDSIRVYAKQFGIDEKKLCALGSPAHDKIFIHSADTTPRKDFILVSAGSATVNHVKDYLVSTDEEYRHALREICKSVSKAGKKLVIKIHPYIDGEIEKKIAKEIDPEIQVINKGDMGSLIESCEVLITLAITSVTLDAQILEKPVIRLPLKEWWGPPDTLRTSPGHTVNIEDFDTILHKILHEPDFHQKVVEDGKFFVNESLSNQGVSSQCMADFLKNCKKN